MNHGLGLIIGMVGSGYVLIAMQPGDVTEPGIPDLPRFFLSIGGPDFGGFMLVACEEIKGQTAPDGLRFNKPRISIGIGTAQAIVDVSYATRYAGCVSEMKQAHAVSPATYGHQ
jgi:hypothetical protein